MAGQADVHEALLRRLGIGRTHVLAHDYGDTVAQELLARELEGRARLHSVCFLNGGLFPETHRARFVQKLLAAQLKDKPLTAARSALQNDELMRKAFGALYDCLPRPVCRFIGEDAFMRFCLQHRERLLKSPVQAGQGTEPAGSPPANET
jgi:pimeloyl-ACP methyl ester carboxylesterase